MNINYFDRKKNAMQKEAVLGEAYIRWIYQSVPGKCLLPLLTRRFISKAYGFAQSLPSSAKKIAPFVSQFNIEMDKFERSDFRTFNQFFIRRFVSGARTFIDTPTQMPAGCEARYLGFNEVTSDMTFPIKGQEYSAHKLLKNKKWEDVFAGGPLLVARLAPVDYHRFHFMDDGVILDQYRISGHLHSVSPIALKEYADILSTNERQVTILRTKNFGDVAMIEIGALCVGAIVQTYEGNNFKRGQEKGYFLFGGSTVAFLGCKGAWKPAADIIDHSARGIETLVQLGDWVATASN